MIVFSGQFDKENWYQTWKVVLVDAVANLENEKTKTFSPARSLKVRNHSPDGFAWGYCGSGPAQLALGILLEVTDKKTAELLYQDFKSSVIAALPQEEGSTWVMTSNEVKQWIEQNRQ